MICGLLILVCTNVKKVTRTTAKTLLVHNAGKWRVLAVIYLSVEAYFPAILLD